MFVSSTGTNTDVYGVRAAFMKLGRWWPKMRSSWVEARQRRLRLAALFQMGCASPMVVVRSEEDAEVLLARQRRDWAVPRLIDFGWGRPALQELASRSSFLQFPRPLGDRGGSP